MRIPFGSEPIRNVPELGFEDWFQELFDRALNDAVRYGWDTGFIVHLLQCALGIGPERGSMLLVAYDGRSETSSVRLRP